jgi:hypothetical protein
MAFGAVCEQYDHAALYQERPLAALGRTVAAFRFCLECMVGSADAQPRCTSGGGTPKPKPQRIPPNNESLLNRMFLSFQALRGTG